MCDGSKLIGNEDERSGTLVRRLDSTPWAVPWRCNVKTPISPLPPPTLLALAGRAAICRRTWHSLAERPPRCCRPGHPPGVQWGPGKGGSRDRCTARAAGEPAKHGRAQRSAPVGPLSDTIASPKYLKYLSAFTALAGVAAVAPCTASPRALSGRLMPWSRGLKSYLLLGLHYSQTMCHELRGYDKTSDFVP